MKLVVDTNIFFKALTQRATVRSLLLDPRHQFYVPEYLMEEVGRHLPLIAAKAHLAVSQVQEALRVLLANMQVIPAGSLRARWQQVEEIIGQIDQKDVPFVAAALSVAADGIWSDDKDFKRQRAVRVWSTAELLQAP